ncbi:hypothetical protein [uncultured Mediterranean phage]|nr:hypothetical protein [uncultured Mediterranean phage]
MGRRTKIPLEIIFYTLSVLIVLTLYKGCYTIEGNQTLEKTTTESRLEREAAEKKMEISKIEEQNVQARTEEACGDDLCEIARKYKEKSDDILEKKRGELRVTQDSIQELKDTRVAARNMKNNMDEMEKGELKSANLASSTYDAYSKLAPALQNIVRMAKKK